MCMFKKINCADSNSYGKFRIRYNRDIIESVILIEGYSLLLEWLLALGKRGGIDLVF